MDAKVDPAVGALEELIDMLHARGRPRVWSLVTTVFGDSVLPRGGRIGLSALQEIMGRLRIEPGALRTALSRLASDGTLEREKDGRNAFYSLSQTARPAFERASRKIYAAGPPDWDGRWTVAVSPLGTVAAGQAAALSEAGFASAGAGSWLRPELGCEGDNVSFDAAETDAGLLVLSAAVSMGEVPRDVARLWNLDDLAASYSELIAELSPLSKALTSGGRLTPLDALAARTLVNHFWRRIVLRDPGLPAELLPKAWPGETARAIVRGLYANLDVIAEGWLDAAGVSQRASSDAGRFR